VLNDSIFLAFVSERIHELGREKCVCVCVVLLNSAANLLRTA
jgi:hypothetical protein